MKLQNLLEEEVINVVNRLMDKSDGRCSCDKCKLDIVAITLNKLKPKYVVTKEGGLYGKLDTLNQQHNTDIVLEVTKAMEIVFKNPYHKE